MPWWLILVLALLLFGRLAVYVVRCLWNPFTTRSGRRRAPFWLRGWWRGEQAQNRDDRWT
jgi:hypothetical protein